MNKETINQTNHTTTIDFSKTPSSNNMSDPLLENEAGYFGNNNNNNNNVTSATAKTDSMKDIKFLYLAKKLSLIAVPGMMFYLFLILLQVINLIFIGKKYNDVDMIEGIGWSNLYMNCTMFSIVQGLVSGIDTLCSTAYANKKYKLMGLYVHRARIITYIATVVIVIIHVFTVERIFKLFAIKQEVITYSLKYIYVCLIYVFFDVHTACNFRFLNVIRKSHVNFIVLVIGGVLHPLWNYIFISYLDLNVVGAGISFTISRFIICLCSTLYLHFWNPLPESYFWFNKSCFKGLWTYLKFSMGAAFLLCAEWWAFEIQSIIAIYISNVDYTVHIFIANFSSLIYSVCMGFSFACNIVIGELVAKQNSKLVIKSVRYSLLFGAICMVLFLGIIYSLKDYLIPFFIQNDEIIEKGTKIIPILCICELFDLLQTVMSAVFRAFGRQNSASLLTFIQFYIVMTTLSFVFGSTLGWGVYGMWIGITIGQVSAFVFYMILFVFIDINTVQKEIKSRIERDQFSAKSFIEFTEEKTDLVESKVEYENKDFTDVIKEDLNDTLDDENTEPKQSNI